MLSETSPPFGTATPSFGGIATHKIRENGCGNLSGPLNEVRNVKIWGLLKIEGDLGVSGLCRASFMAKLSVFGVKGVSGDDDRVRLYRRERTTNPPQL